VTDPDLDRRQVRLDGCVVALHAEGIGEPAIVLLHGFGSAIETWMSVLAPLARHHRVVAYDRPGFGACPLPALGPARDRALGARADVRTAIAALDELDCERAVVVGHSAGGTIAAALAIEAPERVAGLVLVDAAIGPGLSAPAYARRLAANPTLSRLGIALTRAVAPRAIGPAMRVIHHGHTGLRPELIESYRRDLAGPTWADTVFALAALESLDPSRRLHEISCPTLVLTGSDDRIVPPRYARALADEIPDAHLVVFRGVGHSPHEEQPAQFVAALEPFLADLRSGREQPGATRSAPTAESSDATRSRV
jgi:pimeloyl-ACP methyl ester carboxylesterase